MLRGPNEQDPTGMATFAQPLLKQIDQKRLRKDVNLDGLILTVRSQSMIIRDHPRAKDKRIDGLRMLGEDSLGEFADRFVLAEVALVSIERGLARRQ